MVRVTASKIVRLFAVIVYSTTTRFSQSNSVIPPACPRLVMRRERGLLLGSACVAKVSRHDRLGLHTGVTYRKSGAGQDDSHGANSTSRAQNG